MQNKVGIYAASGILASSVALFCHIAVRGRTDVKLALAVGILFSVTIYNLPSAASSHEAVQVTYLGNAGWQIEGGGKTILVDPYISQFDDKSKDRGAGEENADPIMLPDTVGIDA